MDHQLTHDGYEQTKEKLRELRKRLLEIEKRTETSSHKERVGRSYKMMMSQYLLEISMYEAKQIDRPD